MANSKNKNSKSQKKKKKNKKITAPKSNVKLMNANTNQKKKNGLSKTKVEANQKSKNSLLKAKGEKPNTNQKKKNSLVKKDFKSDNRKFSKNGVKKRLEKLSKKVSKLKNDIKTFNNKKLKQKVINIEEKKKISEELKNSKKKNVEEKLNINLKFILFLLLISMLIIFIIAAFEKDKDRNKQIEFNKISINEYFNLYNNKNLSYVYIKENNCIYCSLIEEYLNKLEIDYKIKVEELNISSLNEEEMKKLEESNSAFEEGWKAPLVFSINNGQEVSSVIGYKEYSVFKKFVEYSNDPGEAYSFAKISIDKYISILNSNESAIIYIGRSKSNACRAYNPILESVTKKKNIKVYYIDTDSIDTEKEWAKLSDSNDIFKDTWFTPATLIVKDGSIIDYKFESMDVDSLEYFLRENGV